MWGVEEFKTLGRRCIKKRYTNVLCLLGMRACHAVSQGWHDVNVVLKSIISVFQTITIGERRICYASEPFVRPHAAGLPLSAGRRRAGGQTRELLRRERRVAAIMLSSPSLAARPRTDRNDGGLLYCGLLTSFLRVSRTPLVLTD